MIINKTETENLRQFKIRLAMMVSHGQILESEAEDSYEFAYQQACETAYRESCND